MTVVVFSEWDAGWTVFVDGSRIPFDDHLSAGDALRAGLGHKLTGEETELAEEMAALYKDEIDCRVTFDGSAWKGEIGDEFNGFDEERDQLTLAALVDWLPLAANRAFPHRQQP